jgi:hypothetical protein
MKKCKKKWVLEDMEKIKERNVAFLVILNIITFGIYYFIWLFMSSNELGKINKKAPNSKLLWSFLVCAGLILILLIFILILKPVSTMANILGILFILIAILEAVLYIIILVKYSKAYSEITGFNNPGIFLLLFFLSLIGAAIAQDKLNKIAQNLQKT